MLINIVFASTPLGGIGFIAGTTPDGLVTLGGSPGRAEIMVLVRSTMTLSRATFSHPTTGEWMVHGLTSGVEYTVVARDPSRTYKDMIEGAVTPVAYT